nr:NAD-dependent epimerase/dehydratase family protein [Frankia gtarii]
MSQCGDGRAAGGGSGSGSGISVLVLGGTQFLGRAVVTAALARGHEVTLLHRGEHEPPSGARVLRADRTRPDGLAVLADGVWDLVVDTWSGDPAVVRRSTDALRDRAGHYTFVSSRSVYAWPAADGADESAPLVEAAPDDDPDDYAWSKRAAETAVLAVFGHRALLVRAGLLIGPHENSGRLSWWLSRIGRGGVVAAPGPADLDLQHVDARDLASWLLTAADRGMSGAVDGVGPPGSCTMGELLEACVAVTGASAELRWLEPEHLLAEGVTPWTDLPIWMPPGPEHAAVHRGAAALAAHAGLRLRPLTQTVADTWAWMSGPDGSRLQAGGLPPEVERRLLETAPPRPATDTPAAVLPITRSSSPSGLTLPSGVSGCSPDGRGRA